MTMHTSRGLSWLFDTALPLWAGQGVDSDTHLFYEALDFHGNDGGFETVRSRVQARQIYVFASAHAAGWSGPALELAEAGFFVMRAGGWRTGKGWAARLDRQGNGLDWQGDLYDQAFVLLALARLFEVTGAPEYQRHIDETLAFIDTELKDEHGGYSENLGRVTPRRQNSHMHLLEAFLALSTATGDDAFIARAQGTLDLFATHFVNAENQGVHEMFDAAWHRVPGGLEPGHIFEWSYLLTWLSFCADDAPLIDQARDLFTYAKASGLSHDGFAVDAIDEDARVTLPTRRLWPQTEYLRALQLFAPGEYERFQALVFDSYLDTDVNGLWHDKYNLDGGLDCVRVPASSLYHLWGGLMPVDGGLVSQCKT